MAELFISYSRKDSAFVHTLHAALTEHGRETWVDWEDIPLTADWFQEIQRAIDAAHTFIFVISPDSVASQVCNQELEYALQRHKRLVPLVRREAMLSLVHPELRKYNFVYFRDNDDFDSTFAELLRALDTD